jgi:hypothetical protein
LRGNSSHLTDAGESRRSWVANLLGEVPCCGA